MRMARMKRPASPALRNAIKRYVKKERIRKAILAARRGGAREKAVPQ